MKQTGTLVVLLRGVNFGLAPEYFLPPRSHLGFREETQNYAKRSQIFLRFMTMLLKSTFR